MTTQDKPAVGPLGAGDVKLLVKGDLLSVRSYAEQVRLCRFLDSTDEPAPVLRVEQDGQTAPNCWGFHRFAFIGRPGPDGWILWSGGENPVPGQRVEVRFRSGVVRANHLSDAWTWTHGTNITDIIAFRLAPTAPVEAGGSEDKRRREITAVMSALDRFEDLAGRVTATQAEHVLASLSALRHQPSGETREAVARIVDPEAFAVPIPDLRGIQVQRANERKAAALTKADDILALLRPAAPGGGEVILTNGNRLKPGGPLRKFQRIAKHDGHVWVKALNGNYEGELLTFRADTLSAIPASEGGEG